MPDRPQATVRVRMKGRPPAASPHRHRRPVRRYGRVAGGASGKPLQKPPRLRGRPRSVAG
ncbi:Uncharacterised protein [Amycolatopsis camponoti]|uniref:Uncharacterized protein n=1 Tax=Amycolatopsis camponoti TaxID=2606593 RepID=A0A6I8LTN5_9PSEU|nr:Uncharacterised protein [Amycolatopsis camponoti]